MTSLQAEHNWLVEQHKEAKKYAGQWIAILGNKIVAHGRSLQEVYRKAIRQHPRNPPLVTYVPKKDEEIFIF